MSFQAASPCCALSRSVAVLAAVVVVVARLVHHEAVVQAVWVVRLRISRSRLPTLAVREPRSRSRLARAARAAQPRRVMIATATTAATAAIQVSPLAARPSFSPEAVRTALAAVRPQPPRQVIPACRICGKAALAAQGKLGQMAATAHQCPAWPVEALLRVAVVVVVVLTRRTHSAQAAMATSARLYPQAQRRQTAVQLRRMVRLRPYPTRAFMPALVAVVVDRMQAAAAVLAVLVFVVVVVVVVVQDSTALLVVLVARVVMDSFALLCGDVWRDMHSS